jgi:hypothetical protein
MDADPQQISEESSSTDAEELRRTHIGQWGAQIIRCRATDALELKVLIMVFTVINVSNRNFWSCMHAIFQLLQHNEKWWYVIPMASCTKPLFHSLLPESGQLMDRDHTTSTSDQRGNNRTLNPSDREEIDGSWVATQLFHNDVECAHADTGSLLDVGADDVDPDLAPTTSEYDEAASNTDPSVDLCIVRFRGHD